MQIEEGKSYRTRDGQKVVTVGFGKFSLGKNFMAGVIGEQPYGWYPDGSYSKVKSDHPLDLIAEWTDPASDTPRPFGELTDAEGWSEWTSTSEWDVSKHDVQMECIDGIHRVRTRPRQPVRETVNYFWKDGEFGIEDEPILSATHRITFDIIDGKPDCASVKMEKLS